MMSSQTPSKDPDQFKASSESSAEVASSSAVRATFDKFDFSLDPTSFGIENELCIKPSHSESVAEMMNRPRDTPVKPLLKPISSSNSENPAPLRPQAHALMNPNTAETFTAHRFGKYIIDMPLPHPDRFRITRPTRELYYQTFRIPFLCIFLSGLFFILWLNMQQTFFGIASLLCICITVTLLILHYPAFLLPRHATPQEAAETLLRLRRYRCLLTATSIIATPAEADADTNLQTLWHNTLPPWPQALKARFCRPVPFKTHLAAGGIHARSAILLIEQGTIYYLIPVVHLMSGWYVTDPTMTPHRIPKTQP